MKEANMENETLASVVVQSVRESDGDAFAVAIRHRLIDEAVHFDPVGAMTLAMRLVVAAQLAKQGGEGAIRVWLPDEENVQAACAVEAYQTPLDEPCVRLCILDFEITMAAASAIWLAARIAYAAEIAGMKREYEVGHEDLTEHFVAAAFMKLRSDASKCHARTVALETGKKS
jgi:hypothetical protein